MERQPGHAIEAGDGNWGLSAKEMLIVTSELGFAPQETRVVGLAIQGRSNKEVAGEMRLSVATVKLYLHNVYAKARVTNRTELTRRVFGVLYRARENEKGPEGKALRR